MPTDKDSLELLILEFGRSFNLITNILTKLISSNDNIKESVTELKNLSDDIINILTNDKDGIRKSIENKNQEKVLKIQDKWNTRKLITSILIPLLTAIVASGLTYLFAK